jgi:hypothetical protein
VQELAAIMFTDIVKYTALMQGDEEMQYYEDGRLSIFEVLCNKMCHRNSKIFAICNFSFQSFNEISIPKEQSL